MIIAGTIVAIYALVSVFLFALQTRLIFYPGRLPRNFQFKASPYAEEVNISTQDGESINALFFQGNRSEVILYFHGNAGDLSGWQFVAEDFTSLGYNFMIIDYRGYGKSSGKISENGFYRDANAAYDFLIAKGFDYDNVIVYGRSIGSGVAVNLASERACKLLVLESPFGDLPTLANEKLPFFFPSLYLRYRFDNISKINDVKSPVIFLHGSLDTLIPSGHSKKMFDTFKGQKKLIMVDRGSHNDLQAFSQYQMFLREDLPNFGKTN